jgi:hypothetical protein
MTGGCIATAGKAASCARWPSACCAVAGGRLTRRGTTGGSLLVQGYLQYWDDILARNPRICIDSCASGGRRDDLATMRRSVPLHSSDFGCGNYPVKFAFHRVLFP